MKRLIDPLGAERDADLLWETFHENSKISVFDMPPSDEDVLSHMKELAESLEYRGYPVVELPRPRAPLAIPLDEAMRRRATARHLTAVPVSVSMVATLLHSAYGISRDQRSLGYPRAFRSVPSAGAMYPLELYLYAAPGMEFESGLYHYHPTHEHLRLLRRGDLSDAISGTLVQPHIVREASLMVFVTALFGRSTFKYGDRGYRFVLIEAGHVAQNLNLAATGLELGCINVGGFYDRKIDDFLDLDGLTHSTIYVVAVGKPGHETVATS
jgi:SagB-type dehydrogenase family enzyme